MNHLPSWRFAACAALAGLALLLAGVAPAKGRGASALSAGPRRRAAALAGGR